MNSEIITQALREVEESDKALAAAFERRLDAIKVIAEYRREHGIPDLPSPTGASVRRSSLPLLPTRRSARTI